MKVAPISLSIPNNTKNGFFVNNHAKKIVFKFHINLNQNEVTFIIEVYRFNQKNKINIIVMDLFKILDNKTKKEIEKIM